MNGSRGRAEQALFVRFMLLLVFLAVLPLASCKLEGPSLEVTKQSYLSRFSPGMSNVDSSLSYPWKTNSEQAVQQARALASQGLTFVNNFLMGWGSDNPWPDPDKPEPDNWASMDRKLELARQMGAHPVISLCEAPWWMKGELRGDGTTRLLTPADDFAEVAYSSRVLDNQMDNWLHLVRRVAERYMVAPYNVRFFQIWNEFKGYYNPATNNWDVSTSPGEPDGPNAKHGYTYMYNRVYETLKMVAKELDINPSAIFVGGPYIVVNTWLHAQKASHPSQFIRSYGMYDNRDLAAISYWLEHKRGAEFITLSGNNRNRDDVEDVNPFTAAEKFADVVRWLRSLDANRYPGARTLPIWWAEWYADSYQPNELQGTLAVKTYAMMRFIEAGGSVALIWGGNGEGESTPLNGLWTSTAVENGGRPLPWFMVYRVLNNCFSAGSVIYRTYTTSLDIAALAGPIKTIIVNKTADTRTVNFERESRTLKPYEVLIVDTARISTVLKEGGVPSLQPACQALLEETAR